MKNITITNKKEIVPEEFGFTINPNCRICNSVYKPEIDKMIMDGVMLSRIVDFCMVIDPETGKQRVPGKKEHIKRSIVNHRKHITIDRSKIEQAQEESMLIYQAKVKEEISLEKAKQLATQRMIDQLADAKRYFTLGELAIPITLEQRERSVKAEEDSVKIAFAKFITQSQNEERKRISPDEIKSLGNTIKQVEGDIKRITREIQEIERGSGKD